MCHPEAGRYLIHVNREHPMPYPSSLQKVAIALFAALGLATAQADEFSIGQPAPDFTLVDQNGKQQRLSAYQGQWVILYFYPKNDTPGCTKEACGFRDDIMHIKALGAQVLGVSLDSAASHAAFAEKHGLPFPLLSDAEATVSKTYGTYWSLGPLSHARRHTFIIDPAGHIAKIYRKVDPDTHSSEVITALKTLQKPQS